MKRYFYSDTQGYMVVIADEHGVIHFDMPQDAIEIEPQPSPLHKYENGQWVAPSQAEVDAATAALVRAQRDFLLVREVDPVASNALRWASISAEQQQAWADYRQALLDVPQQPGFPHNVTWPSKPE